LLKVVSSDRGGGKVRALQKVAIDRIGIQWRAALDQLVECVAVGGNRTAQQECGGRHRFLIFTCKFIFIINTSKKRSQQAIPVACVPFGMPWQYLQVLYICHK